MGRPAVANGSQLPQSARPQSAGEAPSLRRSLAQYLNTQGFRYLAVPYKRHQVSFTDRSPAAGGLGMVAQGAAADDSLKMLLRCLPGCPRSLCCPSKPVPGESYWRV